MRLLEPLQQARVLNVACTYLLTASAFRIESESKDGPCGSSVKIITSEEEGLFGRIAVNYLMDGFVGGNKDEKTTYGFCGASTQIAFEPADGDRDVGGNGAALVDVRLRLLGGMEIKHEVFVTTWLGFGTNQARERYVAETIKGADGIDARRRRLAHDTRPVLPGAHGDGFLASPDATYVGGHGIFRAVSTRDGAAAQQERPVFGRLVFVQWRSCPGSTLRPRTLSASQSTGIPRNTSLASAVCTTLCNTSALPRNFAREIGMGSSNNTKRRESLLGGDGR